MAKTITLADNSTVTITNNAVGPINLESYTGKRTEMTLEAAKNAGYTQWEYALDDKGNFITTEVPEFDASKTYAVGDIVTKDGVTYRCKTAITTAAAWDASKWEAIDGNQVTESNVIVIVRQAVISTDRFIQFFKTQQKLKLAKGDSITIPVKDLAAYAYYMSFGEVDGLDVTTANIEA